MQNYGKLSRSFAGSKQMQRHVFAARPLPGMALAENFCYRGSMPANEPIQSDGMPLLVTAAVIFDGHRVLLTRRPENKRHPGYWEFPGGKVEPGESPEQSLVREMREELDVSVKVGDIFAVVHYRYEWGAVLILAYECQLTSGPLRNHGVAEHCWVLPAELDDFRILPADQPIIARLQTLQRPS